MKVANILPLASIATAFVVPDAQVFEHLAVEPRQKQSPIKATWADIKNSASSVKDNTANALDVAIGSAQHLESEVATSASDVLSWGHSKAEDAWTVIESLKKEHHRRPKHMIASPFSSHAASGVVVFKVTRKKGVVTLQFDNRLSIFL